MWISDPQELWDNNNSCFELLNFRIIFHAAIDHSYISLIFLSLSSDFCLQKLGRGRVLVGCILFEPFRLQRKKKSVFMASKESFQFLSQFPSKVKNNSGLDSYFSASSWGENNFNDLEFMNSWNIFVWIYICISNYIYIKNLYRWTSIILLFL